MDRGEAIKSALSIGNQGYAQCPAHMACTEESQNTESLHTRLGINMFGQGILAVSTTCMSKCRHEHRQQLMRDYVLAASIRQGLTQMYECFEHFHIAAGLIHDGYFMAMPRCKFPALDSSDHRHGLQAMHAGTRRPEHKHQGLACCRQASKAKDAENGRVEGAVSSHESKYGVAVCKFIYGTDLQEKFAGLDQCYGLGTHQQQLVPSFCEA